MMPPNFDGLYTLFIAGAIALAVTVPLAVWKMVEAVIWLFNHVHIS